MVNFKKLLINLVIPLGIGGISSFLTRNSMSVYANINLPSFAPPSILFPIVWIILYTLMGISSYLVSESSSPLKNNALTIYGIQLLFNFIWPLIFFNAQAYLIAFIWLILLIMTIIWFTTLFYGINKTSTYLQVPYILWSLFAACLNFGVYWLNR